MFSSMLSPSVNGLVQDKVLFKMKRIAKQVVRSANGSIPSPIQDPTHSAFREPLLLHPGRNAARFVSEIGMILNSHHLNESRPLYAKLNNITISRLVRFSAKEESQFNEALIAEASRFERRISYSIMDISELIHSVYQMLSNNAVVSNSAASDLKNLINTLLGEISDSQHSLKLVSEFSFKGNRDPQVIPMSALSNICHAVNWMVNTGKLDDSGPLSSLVFSLIAFRTSIDTLSGTRVFHLVSLLDSIS